jgi:hypothetical protein
VNTLSVSLSYLSLSVSVSLSLSLGFNNYHNFGVWVGAFLDSEKNLQPKKQSWEHKFQEKKDLSKGRKEMGRHKK